MVVVQIEFEIRSWCRKCKLKNSEFKLFIGWYDDDIMIFKITIKDKYKFDVNFIINTRIVFKIIYFSIHYFGKNIKSGGQNLGYWLYLSSSLIKSHSIKNFTIK